MPARIDCEHRSGLRSISTLECGSGSSLPPRLSPATDMTTRPSAWRRRCSGRSRARRSPFCVRSLLRRSLATVGAMRHPENGPCSPGRGGLGGGQCPLEYSLFECNLLRSTRQISRWIGVV